MRTSIESSPQGTSVRLSHRRANSCSSASGGVFWGWVLSAYTGDGVGYGSAMVGLLIGVWCFRLGRDRLEPIPRVLISLYLVVLVVAPYSLGWGVFHTSQAMVYNRYGYALLGLVMLESFETVGTPRRGKGEWS